MKGIAVCTTPRSGSNLLAEAMTATGVLGEPQEYFNHRGRWRYGGADYPSDPREQIDRILASASPSSGVYAFKAFYGQSEKALRRVDWTRALPDLHYVMLTRDDLLDQAISLEMSRQTGRYRSTDAATVPPQFDARRIRRGIGQLAADNASWEVFFARRGISPLRLRYEAMVGNVAGVLRDIGHFAGVAVEPDLGWNPRLAVQRNGLNSEWRERYLKWDGNAPSVWNRLRF